MRIANNRAGFTALELATVMTLIGIIMAMTFPHLHGFKEREDSRSAQQQIAAYAAMARAAAIQRGRTASMRFDSDSMWVTADTVGSALRLRPAVSLRQNFGVTVTADQAVITFDPRGFSPSTPAAGVRYVVRRGALRDTVCVTRMGRIKIKECA
jgi:prepilin-type N-terminal cleavage/methylation domain-containing protein